MSEASPIELVEEAKKPGVFNIIDAIKGRALPTDTVRVYLDEDTAYKAANLKTKLESTNSKDVEYKKIQEKLDALTEKLEQGKYVFHLSGITEGRREEIYSGIAEKFPIDYEETTNPFTGEKKREEVESPERDRVFTSLLWQEHIDKIVAPDGSEQTELSIDDVNALRAGLPIAATGTINQTIEKLRAATAMFMLSVDEDFLAKP